MEMRRIKRFLKETMIALKLISISILTIMEMFLIAVALALTVTFRLMT